MTGPLDLKKTGNLPNAPFPMKANLPTAEPKMLDQWNHDGLYAKIRAARAGRPMYVLHDGPPLRQRRHPPRPRLQQDPQGLHR